MTSDEMCKTSHTPWYWLKPQKLKNGGQNMFDESIDLEDEMTNNHFAFVISGFIDMLMSFLEANQC